jgi:TolB protein
MKKTSVLSLSVVVCLLVAGRQSAAPAFQAPSSNDPSKELRIWKVPNAPDGAESYFSPDSRTLIYNGQAVGDAHYQVYTVNIDGTNLKRINDKGSDACSYFNPNGKGLIWTSTRDNLDLPEGNYSDPRKYPQGAEIYTSDLDGGHVVRLTFNRNYDAEVTYAPDGHRILFGRQIDGKMDLWTMDPDGKNQKQITFTPDWQEGGSVYMPDNRTIILRAWKKSDEDKPVKPMQLFTVKEDGSDFRQITFGEGTHWAPNPAPDGIHVAYVKVVGERNFELSLLNLKTGEDRRLTWNDAFDGFPSFSPDGRLLSFSSSRGSQPGQRSMGLFLMDVSSLGLGPRK